VITESDKKGPFADLLAAVVALDDAWALVIFSIGVALVNYYLKLDNGAPVFLLALWEILGAVGLGVALGLPAAFLTGRVKPGRPMLTEALGVVFLCGGLALWLDVSFLIAAMALGATITNLARHHEYPFHEVENIEWPFMAAFFLLAGASLEFDAVLGIGFLGVAYIVLRALGKYTGGYLGARLGGAAGPARQWVGVALLPQAGVSIGMGLLAANKFPELGTKLLAVIIGTTVFFELVGPLCTRLALNKVPDTQ
jgi:Kef-type K+ transport system membrane component KefB